MMKALLRESRLKTVFEEKGKKWKEELDKSIEASSRRYEYINRFGTLEKLKKELIPVNISHAESAAMIQHFSDLLFSNRMEEIEEDLKKAIEKIEDKFSLKSRDPLSVLKDLGTMSVEDLDKYGTAIKIMKEEAEIIKLVLAKEWFNESTEYLFFSQEEKEKCISKNEWKDSKGFKEKLDYIENKQKISEEIVYKKLKSWFDKWKSKEYTTKKDWLIKTIATYATNIAMFELYNWVSESGLVNTFPFGGFEFTTPCMIGFLPLRHVRSIEIAKSGKILKFRADGSIFLAQQEGTGDAIKIEFLIVKTELWILFYLFVLYEQGTSELKEVDKEKFKQMGRMIQTDTLRELRELSGRIEEHGDVLTVPSYKSHKTFTFVSRHVIIPNVYIETISFEDRVEEGMDTIRCSVMLRTYKEPKKIITHSSGSRDYFIFGDLEETKTGRNLNLFNMVEYSANMIYRIALMTHATFSRNEWKITGHHISSREDVYYNIDPVDIAATFAIALARWRPT